MEKLEYRQVGDYLIPNITMRKKILPTGKYAIMRLNYLKEHKRGEYTMLKVNNTLAEHLEEIQNKATEMIEQIMKKLQEKENITEELKAQDQMKWVGLMNNCKMIAEEQVVRELIYN